MREGARSRTAVAREFWLTEMQDALAKIADRLTAIERHLGITTRPAESSDSPGQEPDDPPGQEPDNPPGQEPDDPPGGSEAVGD